MSISPISQRNPYHAFGQFSRQPIILIPVILVSAALLWWGCAGMYGPGQTAEDMRRGTPIFDHEVAKLVSSRLGMTDVAVMVQIPYDNLQFVRADGAFKARYELMVVITDSIGAVVTDNLSTYSAEEKNYFRTNSRSVFSHARTIVSLPNGTYKILVEVTDHESQQRSRVSETITLQQGSSDCRLSDLVLMRTNPTAVDPRDFVPVAGSRLTTADEDLSLYYETAHAGDDAVTTSWELIKSPSDTLVTGQDTLAPSAEIHHNSLPLDLKNRGVGDYVVNLRMSAGACHQSTSKRFSVIYEDLPRSITDIDQAIEQLRYIAADSEMSAMRKAFQSQKLELFKKFWDERDPTPGTSENEEMDEYYRRVDYANQQYSTQRPGWMTDRGMIYIKYGEPSEMIRNLMPQNQRPYEIWIYHELNLQFEFVDRTGFGDYELIGPISDW